MILGALCILFTTVCNAQNEKLYNILGKAIKLNEKAFHKDEFYEKGYAFSVNIGVKLGIVDTVIISNKDDKELHKLFDFDTIVSTIRNDKQSFRENKSECLVLLIVVIRGDELLKINNGEHFLNEWLEISKTASGIEKTKRKQVFLSPFIIRSKGKSLH